MDNFGIYIYRYTQAWETVPDIMAQWCKRKGQYRGKIVKRIDVNN